MKKNKKSDERGWKCAEEEIERIDFIEHQVERFTSNPSEMNEWMNEWTNEQPNEGTKAGARY